MILEAEFNIRPSRMILVIAAMDVRRAPEEEKGQPEQTPVIVLARAQGAKCLVKGEAQHVMFVIGEIAAQGEDGLTFVREAA